MKYKKASFSHFPICFYLSGCGGPGVTYPGMCLFVFPTKSFIFLYIYMTLPMKLGLKCERRKVGVASGRGSLQAFDICMFPRENVKLDYISRCFEQEHM